MGLSEQPHTLVAGGLWQQWAAATPNTVQDPHEYRQVADQLCSFASECAELFARTAQPSYPRRAVLLVGSSVDVASLRIMDT
ncbi:hypothetical protein [Streptomyces sp. NPDC102437]|uniref:hypothetical protein n=1 Tax=Streptomyces sp. NPDC102437 TaxID=3366175 RepID=UPI003807ECAC